MSVTIEALRAAPLQPTLFEDDGTLLVQAWNKRQQLLAAIEARGAFSGSADHSPAERQPYDTLTDAFDEVPAETLTGLLAKLWVALDYADNSAIRCSGDRTISDAIRRADAGEIATVQDDWDFGPKIILSAIRDVQNMLRFERVYPARRAA